MDGRRPWPSSGAGSGVGQGAALRSRSPPGRTLVPMDELKPAITKTLRRSRDDRMIGGVCGGAAALLGVEASILRILLVAATILGFGSGALIYLACWILIPEA